MIQVPFHHVSFRQPPHHRRLPPPELAAKTDREFFRLHPGLNEYARQLLPGEFAAAPPEGPVAQLANAVLVTQVKPGYRTREPILVKDALIRDAAVKSPQTLMLADPHECRHDQLTEFVEVMRDPKPPRRPENPAPRAHATPVNMPASELPPYPLSAVTQCLFCSRPLKVRAIFTPVALQSIRGHGPTYFQHFSVFNYSVISL